MTGNSAIPSYTQINHKKVFDMMKKNTGFTLIELMITVAILGIVMFLGVPTFKQSMARNQLATDTHAFLTTMMQARMEAIKRAENINVVAMTPANNNEWGLGWRIERAVNSEVLFIQTLNVPVAIDSKNGNNVYRFNSRGFLIANTNDTVTVCHSKVSMKGQLIRIAANGRAAASPTNC